MSWSDPISDKQLDLLMKLCDQKDLSSLPDAQRSFLEPGDSFKLKSNLLRMNREQAAEAITLMLQLPNKHEVNTLPPVPFSQGGGGIDKSSQETVEMTPSPQAGYYFVIDPFDDKEKFYRVQKGKENTRWEGYTFLHVQASDDFYPVKDKEKREAIFKEIAKDPIKSMNEYGMRIGRCGVCGRTLTDRHSILRGIGPICAAKLGPTQEQMDLLNRLGLIKRESPSEDEDNE